MNTKKRLSIYLTVFVLAAGFIFQFWYDQITRIKKEMIRKIYLEMKGVPPTEGVVTHFYLNRLIKFSSVGDTEEKIRELIPQIDYDKLPANPHP